MKAFDGDIMLNFAGGYPPLVNDKDSVGQRPSHAIQDVVQDPDPIACET